MDLNYDRVALSTQILEMVLVKDLKIESIQFVYTAVPNMPLERDKSRVKRLMWFFIEYNRLF